MIRASRAAYLVCGVLTALALAGWGVRAAGTSLRVRYFFFRATALRTAAATFLATSPYFSSNSSGWPDSA